MIPSLLTKGDGVRVITPSRSASLSWINEDVKRRAHQRLEALGLVVTYGKHIDESDMFNSSSIEHRLEDLHDAFADPSVKLILTVIGGYNSNQLLSSIDYDLIRQNPKRLCGYSDITALASGIYQQTGLVTYSGPHFFNFGQKLGFDYTQDAFARCHFQAGPVAISPSKDVIDDHWATNQDGAVSEPNSGWRVHREGAASGTIIGGNVGTLNLLQGTEYMPNPEGDVVLFIEDDRETSPASFDRYLQSLLHQPLMQRVRGIVMGRFERASGMTSETLDAVLRTKRELRNIPMILDVDFGHTTPMITFPIGGKAWMIASKEASFIEIFEH